MVIGDIGIALLNLFTNIKIDACPRCSRRIAIFKYMPTRLSYKFSPKINILIDFGGYFIGHSCVRRTRAEVEEEEEKKRY